MRIGELAKRAGVSTSRIRFYEANGLLPPAARLPNGYRDYGDHDLDVVRFIARAQGLGFTLRDVAAHLSSPQGDARKARLQARLEDKLAELDTFLEQVGARRAVMLSLIDELRLTRASA
ncbi:MerR family transcriptional regulator [Phenylobacterium sp.]|uniref:MerR family transcriptional regulator n=1 Tax=Phenylobacterium sp. TaxID=1871053 RepID=UPI00120741DF|nr:MerR family transcriptional regulator [Phenylobacterium sp.]THD58937.1 MAG: MerR family transcriptional regulator [Phenylobacterium sp.]